MYNFVLCALLAFRVFMRSVSSINNNIADKSSQMRPLLFLVTVSLRERVYYVRSILGEALFPQRIRAYYIILTFNCSINISNAAKAKPTKTANGCFGFCILYLSDCKIILDFILHTQSNRKCTHYRIVL